MLEEALIYFKSRPGYETLFSLFKKKMESLGRVGGSVPVTALTGDEQREVAAFFGMTAEELKQKRNVTLLSFEKKLQQTRFEGITLSALLEGYYGKAIISIKEAKQQKLLEQETQWQHWKALYPRLDFWFNRVLARAPDSYWIYRLQDEGRLNTWLPKLEKAVTMFPDEPTRLPVFSQKVTGDPHAFDPGNELGRLLIHVLQTNLDVSPSRSSNTEDMNDVLSAHSLVRDDIANFVTVANITASTSNGISPLWAAACEQHTVLNMPLREVNNVTSARPAHGSYVWIVENSGVCASLLDEVPEAPLVCTHGQFKLTALRLLDLLVATGTQLIYGGDCDPEGLLMAERLFQRYPGQVSFWKMDEASYRHSLSGVQVSDERLKKLDALHHPMLSQVASTMSDLRVAGYQEAVLPELILELKEYMGSAFE
ncbi:TIGR02679 family protein [Aureibacillus halotolerans]|uniref:Uncharacterized protein (TIGR02679 family) n=1 Tax=Aureibacillus halotolerans TaxID=1508390 RepID=A0A4V3D4B7_9BACI|nr:TIGR02679 family protein [Aureibacillus halotolerans]TDQ34636.1 uncharacterized protein (TIGR02679 family) [Aureibacillus halotolerans]